MKFAKFLWIFPCVVLCACMNNNQRDDAYRGYEEPYQQPSYNQPAVSQPVIQQPVYAEPVQQPVYAEPQETAVNPYALEPPAYEQNVNVALTQKEEELFHKEKNLMDAQQELYEREKKLADREAAFINRSKALDYKEKNIENGRYYAPVVVDFQRPTAPAPVPAFAPTPASAPTPAFAPAPAPVPAQVYRVEPPTSYITQSYPQSMQYGYEEEDDDIVVDLNDCSESFPKARPQSGYIILQHPIQRDLVRGPVKDDVCLESYERLGYVRAENLSRFTAQDELNTAGTYPTNTYGQWRENNTIPRW